MKPVIEIPDGQINGINNTFFTSHTYVPGSIIVFVNGLCTVQNRADGWKELGGKKFRLNEVPRARDVIQVYYLAV